jgi:glycosyltransferase 2 family protein
MRDGVKLALGLAAALALMVLVLRGVDRAEMGAALRGASLWGVGAATVLNIGHNVFRVWRWGALLEPVRPSLSFRPMFTAVIVGYAPTWVLPGRLGELVRPALLSARENVPLGPCLGSVVADRVLDATAIMALFAVGLFMAPIESGAAGLVVEMRTVALMLFAAIAGGLALLVVASAYRERLADWFELRARPLRWAGRVALSVARGTEALARPRLLAVTLVHSVLAWLTIGLSTWIGIRAAGVHLPHAGVWVMLPLLALGVALPVPGAAGSYHAAMKLGLMALFGVAAGPAVAAGILMHLVCTVPVIALGAVLAARDGISLRDVVAAAREVRSLGTLGSDAVGSRPAEGIP